MKSLTAVLFLLASTTGTATAVELDLSGFATVGEFGALTVHNEAFGELAGDISQAMGSRMLGPADSSGPLGFDFGVDLSMTLVDAQSDHWQRATSSDPGALVSGQIHARKGLPYSFELGGSVSHLFGSDMFGFGMDVKWAFVEGYRYAPDLSLRGSLGTVLGNRDMSLLIAGGDFTVSKAFGLSGVVSLAPYAGYSLQFTRASSNVIGLFEGDTPDPQFVLSQNVVRHRAFVGLELVTAHTTVAVEGMLTGTVQTFTMTLGADF